jgi:hypothetical protein
LCRGNSFPAANLAKEPCAPFCGLPQTKASRSLALASDPPGSTRAGRIRYRFLIKKPATSSLRLRATYAFHNPFAWATIPAISTRRVERSISNSTTYRVNPFHVHTSIVKKSAATSRSWADQPGW